MKTYYKGFVLEAKREKTLGGWDAIIYSALRESDGWYMADGFSEDEDTLDTHIKELKAQVDEYLEQPWAYEDPEVIVPRFAKERDEARALATWFFQEVVAPYGFKRERVKALRKRFPWLKENLQPPVWNELLQEIDI